MDLITLLLFCITLLVCIVFDISIVYLLDEITKLSSMVDAISIFNLKNQLQYFPEIKQSTCFDGIIAAYLLNPLKNDYEFSDVAKG